MAKKHFGAMSAVTALTTPPGATAVPAASEETQAQAAEVAVAERPAKRGFGSRLDQITEAAVATGDLMALRDRFTTESAVKEGRPVRRHRTRDLVLHPQNPRPESGQVDLSELRADWRVNGQKDPIHIVPFEGGWGIMEGQRRWLVAGLEGTEEIECFEHPAMTPMEVFLFGMSIHRTRKTQTAFDESVSLQRFLDQGMSRADLMECLAKGSIEYSEVDLSRVLAINSADEEVLRHIRAKPTAFTHRHLYALSRVANVIGSAKAAEVAETIRYASDEKPVSAKSVERLLEQAAADSGKRVRTKTVPKTIRNGDADLGVCKGFANGKIEFVPAEPMSEKDSEALHEAISAAIQGFFASQQGTPG